MQRCITFRSCRAGLPCRTLARRSYAVSRPIVFAGSTSTPEATPDVATETANIGEEKQSQARAPNPAASSVESSGVSACLTPATADVEHTPTSPSSTQGTAVDSTPVLSSAIQATANVEGTLESHSPTPATADAESAPEAQPSSSGNEEPVEREGTPAVANSAVMASHPLEDVPEEEDEDLIGSKELVAEVMDGNAFGKRGEQWVFAQVVAIGMLMFPPLTLKGLVDFGATLALTSGLVFIATAFFNLGRSISPLPEPRKKHQLVVSGIYGYVRHPMYGGLLLAGFGLAVLTRNETRLAILALLWWVLENKVALEEKALMARYPEYAEYKAKVKKFLPFLY